MAVVRDIEPWDELLAAGREDDRLVMQAAQHRREARAVALPEELHPAVTGALEARGVERLWSHQAEALHAAWAGPTIVTTGTASGKSLCFQLPTVDTLYGSEDGQEGFRSDGWVLSRSGRPPLSPGEPHIRKTACQSQ